jgi:hypothetical protein
MERMPYAEACYAAKIDGHIRAAVAGDGTGTEKTLALPFIEQAISDMNKKTSGNHGCLTVGASVWGAGAAIALAANMATRVRMMAREYMIAAEFGIEEYYMEDIRLTEEVVGWKFLQEMVNVPGP